MVGREYYSKHMVLLLSLEAYPLYSNNKYYEYAEAIKHHTKHIFLSRTKKTNQFLHRMLALKRVKSEK